MRLFRKSKPAAEPASDNLAASEPCADDPWQSPSPPPPPPPPVLRLDFELPSLPPASLEFGRACAPANGSDGDNRPLALAAHQQVPPQPPAAPDRYAPAPAASDMSLMPSLHDDYSAIAYDFDYPAQLLDAPPKPQAQSASVSAQLMEQFGYRMHNPPGTSPCAADAAAQQQQQQQQRQLPHSAALSAVIAQQTSARAPTSYVPLQHGGFGLQPGNQVQLQSSAYAAAAHQAHGSPSSRGDGSQTSESDGGVQRLSGSMAAMSLASNKAAAAADGGLRLSGRAQHIQRVREASALGKLAGFSRRAVPEAEEDCPSDLVPLGDLRQQSSNRASAASPASVGSQPQQQACGADPLSPTAHSDMARYAMPMQANPPLGAGAPAFQQMPQRMAPHMLAGMRLGTVGPLPGHPAQYAIPGPMGPTQQQLAQLHQMSYQRGASSCLSLQSAPAMYRSPLQSGPGATFGGSDASRMGALPDHAKYNYTPSPLGQAPIYCQSAMDGPYTMSHPDMPLACQPSTMARHAHPPAGGGMAHAQSAQQLQQLQQQQQQQQQQQVALMSYIPNPNIPKGSILKNPLMRDLNKVKEFSARDYNARPTLLAEADCRRHAKKNMPGLGGTTSHSNQLAPAPPPMPPPPPPMPQYAPAPPRYQPLSPPRRHEHHDHYDPREAHHRSQWPESEYRRPPSRQRLADDGHGYASSASGSSNRRRAAARSSRGHPAKRRQKHPRGHDDEYEGRRPAREFRPREPQQGTRSRHRRRDEREYNHYDYDDYSDSYTSDGYDGWGSDAEGYDDARARRPVHGRRRSERHPRRSSPRRSSPHRSSPRRGRQEPDGRWAKPRQRVHTTVHRPRAGRLDDPRDDRSVLHMAARPARRGDNHDAGVPTSPPGIRPRSQLGRFLANIKRHTHAPSTPAARALAHGPGDLDPASDSDQAGRETPDAEPASAASDQASPSDTASLSPVPEHSALAQTTVPVDRAVVGT